MNRLQRGFSLIELMIGMLIGLLCTLVIATVLSAAEGNRRGTTSGTDAQIAGSLGLYTLQREIASSGYGFASETNAVGCLLNARFNGVVVAALPPRLAPVLITQGVDGASDQIRIISSSKGINPVTGSQIGFTVPVRVEAFGVAGAPGYVPGNQAIGVASSLSYEQGDLVVAVPIPAVPPAVERPCELFEINAAVNAQRTVPRLDDGARWNPANFPTQTLNPASGGNAGSFLVNMGRVSDRIYSVNAAMNLVVSSLDTSNLLRTTQEAQGGVVLLKAMYGRDTNGNGDVDTYDYATPASVAAWQNVQAVRIVVVARSGQYEKDEVTPANPQWDVGTAAAVVDAKACGASNCVELRVDKTDDNWKHYRYRVFDTVVPLRNQRFRSGNVPAGGGA